MHEELFHSPDRPFRATPDPKFYFPHESIETARQTVVRAVNRAEGPVMVLGGAGLGKSLLAMIVAEDLSARLDVVRLHAARLCSRRALLQNILFELQLPYRNLSEGDLRLSLLDRLELSSEHAPDGILMLVDEAHTLPAKLLDELRLITNFTRGNQPRVRLVLIGSLRLEHIFAEPQMESFNQRLAARCYLQPMNRQQTREYVRHQLKIAGVEPQSMITEDAQKTVYAASEGVPRLTNQIMDHALVLAITRGQCPVSAALIEDAWADLQQLPAPWHAGAERLTSGGVPAAATSSSIEFGALDDEDESQESMTLPAASTTVAAAATAEDRGEHAADTATSFFAAFAPPDDEFAAAYPTPALAGQSAVDETCQQLPQLAFADHDPSGCSAAPGDELLTRPRVVFDLQYAREQAARMEAMAGREELAYIVEPTSDSFFCNRPTDERMLALEDEQREYDSLGVWENDPPLAHPSAAATAAPDVVRLPLDLFGDDFDEEVCLSTNQTLRKPRFQFSTGEDAAPCEIAAESSGVRFVDASEPRPQEQAFHEASQSAAQAAEQVIMDGSAANCPTTLESWSVDVAAMDVQNELAVHEEVEDLVSQLNFAAFSVEPFSVEQIDIEPRDQRPRPATAAPRNVFPREAIYSLPTAEQALAEGMAQAWPTAPENSFDDDRDLLVIEEELPLSAATSHQDGSRPVTRTAPYSQLFAKLRK